MVKGHGSEKNSKVLLTGRPGIGKTTIIKKLGQSLGESARGFYTAEIREGRSRRGFEIISLETEMRKTLAHVDFSTSYRVGKYGVCPDHLEPFVEKLEEALKDDNPGVFLIDEIGKMELFSETFRRVIEQVMDSSVPLVATIMSRSEPFCDSLKSHPEAKILTVTANNRDQLPGQLLSSLPSN